MYRLLSITILLIALVCLTVGGAIAQSQPSAEREKAEEPTGEAKEEIKETSHEVVIEGTRVKYKAVAGTMPLKVDIEKPKATIFYIAYTRTDIQHPEHRPITFSFNGGPGSSSVWLHLGLLGPRRVLLQDDGQPLPPPYRLVDNEYSLLDKTDLVFIDPVSTGFSRAVEGENPNQFHGVQEDIKSVGEFIRLYLTRYERWDSPKFLIGESYGTTRAAGLAHYLQDNDGMYLNGVMLLSSVLDFQTIQFNTGNDLPYVLFLPSYTATAWYHQRLAPDLQADLQTALRQAETFASGPYASALLKGDAESESDYDAIVKELARLTGLSEAYVEQSNIRIPMWRFAKELLRDERRTVGRLDSRFEGIDRDAAGESYEYDPSYAAVQGPYSTLMNDYVRRELDFQSDLPYEILTGRVWPWNYSDYENRYLNTAESLRQAVTANPALKVFVGSGYYDLATPYFATDYTFNHLGLDPTLRGNVVEAYYEAGHMMYIKKSSLAKLRADLTAFIQQALP